VSLIYSNLHIQGSLGGRQKTFGVFVHRVKNEEVQRALPNGGPIASVGRVF